MAVTDFLTEFHGVICYVLGLFCGTWLGAGLMCCLFYARDDK
jgi:hypothetical protein